MRVLFIEPMGFGGIFRHAVSLGRELAGGSGGFEVELVTSKDNLELPADTGRLAIKRILGGMNQRQPMWRRSLEYLLSLPALLMHVLSAHPDIVHFHQYTTPYLDWLLFWLLRSLHYTVVLSVHENEPRRRHLPAAVTRVALQLLYRAPHVIVLHSSYAARRLVATYGLPAAKARVIPLGNFLDYALGPLPSQAEARIHLGLRTTGTVILFFGTIRDDKGLHVLLDSLPGLRSQLDDWILLIAGALALGTSFSGYAQHIQSLGLSDHVLARLGYVDARDLPGYFRAADVVALPYLDICQSAVVHLAYAFERPVVASWVGGLTEQVFDGQTGLLVPPNDPEALGRAILELALRSDRGRAMGREGRRIAESLYSWDRIAQQTARVFEAAWSRDDGKRRRRR